MQVFRCNCREVAYTLQLLLWLHPMEGNKQYCDSSVRFSVHSSVLYHVQQRRLGHCDPTSVCGLRTCSISTVVRSDMQLIADSLVITTRAAPLKSKLTIRNEGERWLRLWACSREAQRASDHDEQIALTTCRICCSGKPLKGEITDDV